VSVGAQLSSDVAFWSRAFLDEVEQTPVGPSPMLWCLGGTSFVYRTATTTIWIDPYLGGTPDHFAPGNYRTCAVPVDPDEIRTADVVISTHCHVDHCHRATVLPILANTDAQCVAPATSAEVMRGWGVAEPRLREVAPGDDLNVGDVRISVYGAHDPGEPGAVTYVLEARGTTLFVSGDTAGGEVLREVGASRSPDYALLAFGRTWYMDEQQIIDAARDLDPAVLIPFHWDLWRHQTGDIARLVEIYCREQPPFELKVMLIGDSVAITARQS
jgi:L-ascorbate 6-phosphate lactonase